MINGAIKIRRPIRTGMVGGGGTSQIGYIHRCAATRDRNFEIVAGAFDIDAKRGQDFGVSIGVAADRCYKDYVEMFAKEKDREDAIEAVIIATPNGTHYSISKAALEAGLHVICEKPLCFTTKEAQELVDLSKSKKLVFGVTYGYSGHQVLRQGKKLIEDGVLGEIRIVNIQFAHGFHNVEVEKNTESTKWRVDPKVSGPSYVLGDLTTHTLYLAEMMLPKDMKIKNLLCTRQSFVKSRAPLEDNAYVLMNYNNGAVASCWSSAVNAGAMHQQKIRIVGEKASIEWWDEHPNQLKLEIQGRPAQILDRGMPYIDASINEDDRIGGGHPEGLFESWANLYKRWALAIDAALNNEHDKVKDLWYPSVVDGYEGVKWVEKCVESADKGSIWVDY